MRKVFGLCGAALVALAVQASPALADPVTGGTLTPISLEGGGTVSGSLTLNAAGDDLSSWSITVSGGTVNGFTFTAFTYDETNSDVTIFNDLVYGGKNLTTLDIRTPTYNTNTPGGRDLQFTFERIPDPIPAGGAALGICDGAITCDDPPLGFTLHSGEIVRNPTTSDPFGVGSRNVTAGYFTVSDPPGSISLNFTLTPVLIPVDGGDNGGGGTQVPEPGVLTQLGASALGLVLMARKRKQQ